MAVSPQGKAAFQDYFEAEADRQYAVPGVVSEDALWTLIRPVGTFKMIPGMLHSRFAHTPMVAEARRTHLLMLDYWKRHGNADRQLLRKLGLHAE